MYLDKDTRAGKFVQLGMNKSFIKVENQNRLCRIQISKEINNDFVLQDVILIH